MVGIMSRTAQGKTPCVKGGTHPIVQLTVEQQRAVFVDGDALCALIRAALDDRNGSTGGSVAFDRKAHDPAVVEIRDVDIVLVVSDSVRTERPWRRQRDW